MLAVKKIKNTIWSGPAGQTLVWYLSLGQRTFRDGVRRNASAGWRNHGASGRHAASIGYECPDSDRLNKYRESHGDALKLEARLHLLLHIHCESVEWRELRGGKT